MRKFTTLLARLETWLAAHRPGYHKGLAAGAGRAALDTFQARLGLSLPAELRQLLAWHNGQGDFAGCLEESWNLMSSEEILTARHDLLAPPAEGEPASAWQPAWIPVLADDAGNHVFLDTARAPAPVREFWTGKPEQPLIAAGLAAWLDDFVRAVERGDYREEPERGQFLRQR